MKFNFFVIILLLPVFFFSCEENNSKIVQNNIKTDGSPAKIEFKTKKHDFGTLIQGEKAVFAFKYKNTGSSPLIILSTKASCGCTKPKYDKKPLAPGEEGKINVKDMITDKLPLNEIQKGFKIAAEARNSLKVVLEPNV